MKTDFPPQGAEVSTTGVHYRVWAPKVSAMTVEILGSGGRLLREVPLTPCSRQYFHGDDPTGHAGDLYKFRLDWGRESSRPASRWQPEGVHGPSMVIDPRAFQWTDAEWRRPAFRDLVIYELHVGAFTAEGSFRSAIDRLQHIRDLGANAIELMPIADFAGGRNWGYDGVYLYAPSHAYGSPDDLRALVDAAHRVGLTVILDVVYNHFGPDGNYLHAYIGDYLDEAEKTPWGGAIRYGHPEFKGLRDLVLSNPDLLDARVPHRRLPLRCHARNLRRFLASHSAGADCIHSRARRLCHRRRSAQRHPTGDARDRRRLWFRCRVGGRLSPRRARLQYPRRRRLLGDFGGTLREAVDTLRHGWHYRGQHAKSANQPRGTECAHLPPERFVHCISNHDQTGNHAFGERLSHRILPTALRAAETLLCLSPYTPMLFMGQEWAASTPFLFFTDHNPELGKLIIEGRREEFKHFAAFSEPAVLEKIPNPQNPSSYDASKLVWTEQDRGPHALALELYKTCLALRASDPAFRPAGRDSWTVEELAIGVGALHLLSESSEWVVLFDLTGGHEGNLGREALFQSGDATWQLVLSSNEKRFGGEGPCAIEVPTLRAKFTMPETIVLRRHRNPHAASSIPAKF